MTQTIQTRAQSIYFASELCNSTLLCACIYIFLIMEKIRRWYMIPLQRRLQNATGKTHLPISPQFRCNCSQRDGDTWWRVASTIYHSHLTHYSAGNRRSSALTNWNQHWQDFWGGEKTRTTKNNRGMLFIQCLSNGRKTDPTLSLQLLQTCCGEWCLHDIFFWLSVPKSWRTPKIHVQEQKRGTVSNTEHETVVKSLRVHCTSNYFSWWRSGLSMTQNTICPQNDAHKLLKPKFLPAETNWKFAWISLAIWICSKCLVLISSNWSWNPLIDSIVQNANSVAGFLKR